MSRRGRPCFPDPRLALVAGVALLGAGWFCLYDAYEGRGGRTPAILRPITWW